MQLFAKSSQSDDSWYLIFHGNFFKKKRANPNLTIVGATKKPKKKSGHCWFWEKKIFEFKENAEKSQ